MKSELTTEFNRIEEAMKKCKCGNGLQPVLGECNICDVLYAKHEGMRFAVELLLKEELSWMEGQIVSRHPIDFYNRVQQIKADLKEVSFDDLLKTFKRGKEKEQK